MLREGSAKEGAPAALRGLTDPDTDLAVGSGDELRSLATALVDRDLGAVAAARDRVVHSLGPEAAATAVGVVSNFQMMNRALDAVGIPAKFDPAIATELGIDPGSFGGEHGL